MVMTSLLSHQGHGRINCLASPFWINWSMANAGISRGHHLNYTAYLQYLSIFRGTHGSFNFFPSSFQCYPWIPSTIQYQILYQILLLVLLQRYIFRGTLGSPPPISILSGTPGSIRTSSVFTINPHFDNRTVFDTYNPSNLPLFLPSILILITGPSSINFISEVPLNPSTISIIIPLPENRAVLWKFSWPFLLVQHFHLTTSILHVTSLSYFSQLEHEWGRERLLFLVWHIILASFPP